MFPRALDFLLSYQVCKVTRWYIDSKFQSATMRPFVPFERKYRTFYEVSAQ